MSQVQRQQQTIKRRRTWHINWEMGHRVNAKLLVRYRQNAETYVQIVIRLRLECALHNSACMQNEEDKDHFR